LKTAGLYPTVRRPDVALGGHLRDQEISLQANSFLLLSLHVSKCVLTISEVQVHDTFDCDVCVCVCVCVWSVSRYDNEYGYSTRVTDLVKFVNSKDHP